jgi:FkbM family methyltransferase
VSKHSGSTVGRLGRLAQRSLRAAGLDVRRYRPPGSFAEQRQRMFEHFGTDLILDVGANVGQFAEETRRHGYRGRIVSFEPQRQAFEQLAQAAARDHAWTVRREALGAEDARGVLHVSGNSQSSSLLGMLDRHLEVAPRSGYVADEDIEVRRLDAIAPEIFHDERGAMLKLDVQGFERAALDGATATLSELALVQVECSLVPLYEGETLLIEMLDFLGTAGFTLSAITSGTVDQLTGRSVQVDCILASDRHEHDR